MDRTWLAAGSIAMFLAVALGAFGAHALRSRLGEDLLSIFETGVRYQAWHGLALLAVAVVASRQPTATVTAAGVLFCAGIVLFSGSLYALVLTGVRTLGAITPLGGVAFLAGWACLGWSALVGSGPAGTR